MKFIEFPDLIRRYFSGEPFVIFDTETTGLNTYHDEIIEIAAATWQLGQEPRFFNELLRVNPDHITPGARAVNQIADHEVLSARLPRDVLTDFMAFAEGRVLLAHNAKFDYEMLNSNLIRHGLKPYQNDQIICTLRYAQQQLKPGKLGELARHFKIQVHSADCHRALYDVKLLLGISNHMMQQYEPKEMQYSLIL